MRKAIFGALIVALALFGLAAPVAATTIHVSSPGGPGVTIYSPGTLANTGLGTFAEVFQVTGDLGAFDAYCVDLQHYINTPLSVDVVVDQMTNWTGLAGNLVGNPGAAAWLYNTYATSATANKAALQLAIWDVLYDTDRSIYLPGTIGTDGFWASGDSSLLSAAQTYISAVGSNSSDAMWLKLYNAEGGNVQNLIGPPVPEPGTLLLLGSGLSALALRRRRKS